MTRPESETTLVGFYELIRPAGPGWKPIASVANARPPFTAGQGSPDSISLQLLGWVLGCAFVYATLFGAGSVLFGHSAQAVMWGVVWLISGFGLLRVIARLWRS
jgi:solute:Na+ symporter, SSS family